MKSLHFFLGKKNQHGLRIQEIILKIYKIKILTCQTGAFLFSVSDTITSQKSFLLDTELPSAHACACRRKAPENIDRPGRKIIGKYASKFECWGIHAHVPLPTICST